MAKLVFTNGQILVNGVDLSDHAVSITVDAKCADVDSTAMGAQGKQREYGLRDESVKVKWRQDFAAGKVDVTLAAIYTGQTKITVEVRPVNGGRTVTNPGYNGTCLLTDYQPIAGDVGSIMDAETTFMVDGVLTRSTA